MTEEHLTNLEKVVQAPLATVRQQASAILYIFEQVPKLIAEIRRLRAMLPQSTAAAFPSESNLREAETVSTGAIAAIVRDVREIIEGRCVEGAGFLLTLFDTRGDYEPVYTCNAGRGDTLKALRRVIELVERS